MNPTLSDQVKTLINQGKSKEVIYQELISKGNSIDSIEQVFQTLNNQRSKEDTQKRTVQTIITIAVILVGLGIFSFVAANWDEIGKFFKIGLILTAMLISYVSGWLVTEKSTYQKTGKALLLLGSIIYGAGIFLIGQIFNIQANWPDGFILWMIGVLLMAFVLDLYPMYGLSIILGIATIMGFPFYIFGLDLGTSLFASTSLLILTTILTFVIGILVRKKMPSELGGYY